MDWIGPGYVDCVNDEGPTCGPDKTHDDAGERQPSAGRARGGVLPDAGTPADRDEARRRHALM
jgi:hypothetical protein